MRVRIWHRWPRSLEERWAALLSTVPQHTIFQTWEWNRAWWRAFGRGRRLHLVGIEDDRGDLRGLGPFVITGRLTRRVGARPFYRVVELLGTPNRASDYADVLVAPGDRPVLQELVEWLRRRFGRFTGIDLYHLRDDSPHLGALAELTRAAGLRSSVRDWEQASTRLLRDGAADRALLHKRSLRRHHRGLERIGSVEYRVARSVDEILAELPTFFDQHVRRRALAGARSQFLAPAERRFYVDLARRLFPRGWLHFSSLHLDGAPVAYHFGLQYRGCYLWHKPTFEPRLANRSPGEVLLRFLLEDAIARGFDEFDFTVGAEPFKSRFTNHTRRILQLRVPRPPLIGAVRADAEAGPPR